MGRPRKCRPKKFIFSRVLQHCTSLIRLAGFLERNQFPELVGPVQSITQDETDNEGKVKEVKRFLVVLELPNLDHHDRVWLKFNASGSYAQISRNYVQWTNLNLYKVPKRSKTTG